MKGRLWNKWCFFFSYRNFLITTVNRPRCTLTLKRRRSAVCVLVKTLTQRSHGEEKPAFVYPADSYKMQKRKERTAIKWWNLLVGQCGTEMLLDVGLQHCVEVLKFPVGDQADDVNLENGNNKQICCTFIRLYTSFEELCQVHLIVMFMWKQRCQWQRLSTNQQHMLTRRTVSSYAHITLTKASNTRMS